MLSNDIRIRLARQQAALVHALADDNASVPPGFDAARIDLAARTLRNKRLRTVTRSWPRLATALGEAPFRTMFLDFAGTHPLPPTATPVDDGLAFARHLARSRPLPDEAHLEWQLRELARASRLPLRLIRLRDSHRLVIAIRRPRGLVQWWTIRTRR